MARRPLDGARRITGNTASHAEYDVDPATDYGADSGEIIRAPFAGRVERWWSSTGGNSVSVTSLWVRWVGQHLSAYGNTGDVTEGSVIGYIGSTGSATSGPHLHNFIVSLATGKRYSMEEWLVGQGFTSAPLDGIVTGPYKTSKPAGGDITPFPKLVEDSNMRVLQNRVTKDYVRLGEFSALPLSERNALIEAPIWNPTGKPLVVDNTDFVQAVADATNEGERFAAQIGKPAPVVIDYAKLAALIKVPTATENGAAARAAIVKS